MIFRRRIWTCSKRRKSRATTNCILPPFLGIFVKSLLVVIRQLPLGIAILSADKHLIEVREAPVGGWCLGWKIPLKCAKLDIV